FSRPTSAEASLHPPVVERVREYAYLVAIAIVALGVGAASLAFAQPEHAGMAGTPNPDHPSMNTQTMNPPASNVLTESTRVNLLASAAIQPGQAATLTYRLTDNLTGAPVTDVVDSHER